MTEPKRYLSSRVRFDVLLGAYDLSGEPVLLEKAVDLGDMLYIRGLWHARPPAAPFWFDFAGAKAGMQEAAAATRRRSAAPTSLALEFTRLAQLTGDAKYTTRPSAKSRACSRRRSRRRSC